jgi:hypothetical protein
MNVSQLQQELLSDAQQWVARFVNERGSFSAFALVRLADGQTQPVQPDGFSDDSAAFQAILGALFQLRDDGQLQGCVVVKPMALEGQNFAIYDCEAKGLPRVMLCQKHSKKFFGGWKFQPSEYSSDDPRIFAI